MIKIIQINGYREDNTGDITKTENIIWFGNNVKKNNGEINLVTGDAGIKNVPLEMYQKLEYSQMATVLATCGKNGNCIIKHFLPYINEFRTFESNGLHVNYIFCYFCQF